MKTLNPPVLSTTMLESDSPIPGDFFAITDDKRTCLLMDANGHGFIGMFLPNNAFARFDFAAPGLATFVWGVKKDSSIRWQIKQEELPPAIAPAVLLRRLYILGCATLSPGLCAFSPFISDEQDGWRLFESFPTVMFFALRNNTLVNPLFREEVRKWRI